MANPVTDAEFQTTVLDSDTPVIVDFWGEGCPPCQALLPILEEVSGEMADKAKFVKMNIYENPEKPTQYGVRGIPTLMVFKNGEVAATRVGGMSKSDLTAWVMEQVG